MLSESASMRRMWWMEVVIVHKNEIISNQISVWRINYWMSFVLHIKVWETHLRNLLTALRRLYILEILQIDISIVMTPSFELLHVYLVCYTLIPKVDYKRLTWEVINRTWQHTVYSIIKHTTDVRGFKLKYTCLTIKRFKLSHTNLLLGTLVLS